MFLKTPNIAGSENASRSHFLPFFRGVGTPIVVIHVGLKPCMETAGCLNQGTSLRAGLHSQAIESFQSTLPKLTDVALGPRKDSPSGGEGNVKLIMGNLSCEQNADQLR